ncbi:hypothetical protein DPMN_073536 [Dreissena polymorpha]|uniref:Uncharacterized protein n=1 Tax=Dreissena polymorpha TaxID=45954 RepID=A0A9D4BZC6_DREPO|nr:hypothetical protein DPMN_073536 [Dreissena polymorpha]
MHYAQFSQNATQGMTYRIIQNLRLLRSGEQSDGWLRTFTFHVPDDHRLGHEAIDGPEEKRISVESLVTKIMQETPHDNHNSISIGGKPIPNLRFADDSDLMVGTSSEL